MLGRPFRQPGQNMAHEHILVVEDDETLRSGIRDLLELSGYVVSVANDGAEALELLEQAPESPALIVSDIRMPVMDGYRLLEVVRARPEWLTIPFIFLTAKGEKQDVREGKLRGVDDYIVKPFDFQDLLVAIQSSLNRHEQLYVVQEARLEAIKSRILHVINHEFRTPLTYIIAYANLMASNDSFQHSEELRQYIQGILQGSERLSRLIENFLLLAELESGLAEKIYERRCRPIEKLDSLVREVVARSLPGAEKRGVTLKLEIPGPLPVIEGDAAYLEVAIRELVDNAVRFSPKNSGAHVVVTVFAQDWRLSIRVCDQGPSIPPKDQQYLFDIFYQVDREKLEQGGTGAGLAIVYRVAQLHGGSIRLESQPGKGNCFELSFPVQAGLSPGAEGLEL